MTLVCNTRDCGSFGQRGNRFTHETRVSLRAKPRWCPPRRRAFVHSSSGRPLASRGLTTPAHLCGGIGRPCAGPSGRSVQQAVEVCDVNGTCEQLELEVRPNESVRVAIAADEVRGQQGGPLMLGELDEIVAESLDGVGRIETLVQALRGTARKRNEKIRYDPARAVGEAVTIFRGATKSECEIACELGQLPDLIGSPRRAGADRAQPDAERARRNDRARSAR